MITWASMRRIGHGSGVRIHSTTDTPNGYGVTKMTLHMPTIREDVEDRPRSHGTYDFTEYFGSRAIDLEGIVYAPDYDLTTLMTKYEALVREFSLYGGRKRFTMQRLGRSYKEFLDVRVGDFQCDIDTPGNLFTWSATLIAPDPRIYRLMDPDPRTVSFVSKTTINNTGTGINAPLTVRMYGPADEGAGVRNATLAVERFFRLSRPIAAGTVVEVDTKTRTVTRNGVKDNSILDYRSWFWKIAPGRNKIQRFGTMARVEVDWREARI